MKRLNEEIGMGFEMRALQLCIFVVLAETRWTMCFAAGRRDVVVD